MQAKTSTVVLETALWLLRDGVVNVRGESTVNVKQARCLFHLAAWIQKKKTAEWLEDKNSGFTIPNARERKWIGHVPQRTLRGGRYRQDDLGAPHGTSA